MVTRCSTKRLDKSEPLTSTNMEDKHFYFNCYSLYLDQIFIASVWPGFKIIITTVIKMKLGKHTCSNKWSLSSWVDVSKWRQFLLLFLLQMETHSLNFTQKLLQMNSLIYQKVFITRINELVYVTHFRGKWSCKQMP